MAHDGRLADPLCNLAHQPADQQHKRDLGDEQRLRSTARNALRSERRNGFERGCRAEQRDNANQATV